MRKPSSKEIVLTILSLAIVGVLSVVVFFLNEKQTQTPEEADAGSEVIGGEVQLKQPNIFVTKYDGVQPYKGAPPCPTHNESMYHGIWNSQVGCHYDHTHGADPSQTIFKDIVAGWGQTISYPWQTPNEQLMKHHGYMYVYDRTPDGKCLISLPEGSPLQGETLNCITDILYVVHTMGTNFELMGRFHSFRVVARVCNPTLSQCGFVQTGGWADYGILECPYKTGHCPVPADPNPLPTNKTGQIEFNQPPYRASDRITDLTRALKSGINAQFWTNQLLNKVQQKFYPNPYNQRVGSSWAATDGWGGLDPANPGVNHFICPQGDCLYNHSSFQIFTFVFKELPAGPFSGFTDKKGNIVQTCTSEGPDCIPLVVSAGVPAGDAWLIRQVRPGFEDVAPIHEYDVCFGTNGQRSDCHSTGNTTVGWILPNMNTATIPVEGFITPTTVVTTGTGKVLTHDKDEKLHGGR
ncbi:MAG: hypothetical protein Fur003_5560 [Candidatus Dojkabacteria bacterium]